MPHDLLNKRRVRHPRNEIKPGKAAAIKGYGALGTAKKQPKEPADSASLRSGYLAEEIERSPQRRELLTRRFGKTLGRMVEKGRNRMNLTREAIDTRKYKRKHLPEKD